MNDPDQQLLLKSIHHMVVYLLLRNAHKMTRQATLNGYTESELFCVHLSKVNKLPYNGTILVVVDKHLLKQILLVSLIGLA